MIGRLLPPTLFQPRLVNEEFLNKKSLFKDVRRQRFFISEVESSIVQMSMN